LSQESIVHFIVDMCDVDDHMPCFWFQLGMSELFVLALMWWAVKVYMGCCGDV